MQKISLLGMKVLLTGLRNLKDIQNSRQNRSENKLVRKNAVTPSAWKLLVPGYGLLLRCTVNENLKKGTIE